VLPLCDWNGERSAIIKPILANLAAAAAAAAVGLS